MKSLSIVLIALLVAGWSVAIAILSVQNAFITNDDGEAQLVTLKFLGLQSIQMPFGVALALAFAIGVIAAALLTAWLGRSPKRRLR